MENSKTFIIVEDDEHQRELLRFFLEDFGRLFKLQIQLIYMEDGQQTLDYLENAENMPDLIFSDLRMPRVHGLELLKNLKFSPITAKIPFILNSVFFTGKTREKAEFLGATAVLEKPWELHTLFPLLNRLINEKSMEKKEKFPLPQKIPSLSLQKQVV
ncbi:response regulator [Candidatus Riflebacteria bacterium]